jgi:hypothetical protein
VLPAEVMTQIVAKTDGNPLFVEELTKTVLEAGILIENHDGYRLDGPLPPLAIPATLQDSLMARLDRLAPVREIAQIGAAIGREFSYSLVRALIGRDETALKDGLAQLKQAGLVFCRGEPCARAASGQAAAAPPSSVMNWRRLRSSMGSPPEPAVAAYRGSGCAGSGWSISGTASAISVEQLAGRHERRSTRIGRSERLRPGATSRLPPEVLEPVRCQLGVTHRVLNVSVPEPSLLQTIRRRYFQSPASRRPGGEPGPRPVRARHRFYFPPSGR